MIAPSLQGFMKHMTITKATTLDCNSIVKIGKVSVAESHIDSCSPEVMNEFLERYYNYSTISEELNDPSNFYYMINYEDKPAGFSKLRFNSKHPSIADDNVAMLDRIYLLKEFYGVKLGLSLLNFNIELARNNNQSGMWLYAWIGNERAVNFYLKAGFKIIGSHKYYVNETHYDVSHHMLLNFS